MEYTTFAPSTRGPLVFDAPALGSLYQAFQRLEDPRRVRGRRYELALVLTLLTLTKLMGETTLSGAVLQKNKAQQIEVRTNTFY